MNVKTLLKSIIGTVVIYGVLFASLIILRAFNDVLAVYVIICVAFAVFSFAAGLLFKGQMNALVWSAATTIFFVVICAISSDDWDFGAFIRAVWFVIAQLIIPFFTAKSVARSINEGNERPVGLETAVRDTNKKRALKSIIGTVGIYLVLIASVFILGNFFDVLADYIIYCGLLIVCSIAAGVLFKGQMYIRVWSAASIIFMSVMCDWHLGFTITIGLWYILAPLLIPRLILKAIFISINDEWKPPQEADPPRKAFKTAFDDPTEKQIEDSE